MSLKNTLWEEIKRTGYLALDDIESLCHQEGYKQSNAERRLRELRGLVEPIYNPKHTAIIAYKPLQAQICHVERFIDEKQRIKTDSIIQY
jgi:hypothetical protein